MTESQPDDEPGAAVSNPSPSGSYHINESPLEPERDRAQGEIAQNTPIPGDADEDDLVCKGLHCEDLEPESFELEPHQAWKCEVYVTEHDVQEWKRESNPFECSFLATAAKRQRSEVKLANLTPAERIEFQKAKDQEIQNWLKTGTISKIFRHQVPPDQVLRCRWILTWKPIDDEEKEKLQGTKIFKAKARLVILGYLDPKIAEVPRDSPTLARHSKMLLLQLVASQGWNHLISKQPFCKTKNQQDRILAIEPVLRK